MTLSSKQRGVLQGILLGGVITILVLVIIIVISPISNVPELSFGQRVIFALKVDVLLALWLLLSIGRLARFRFITPEDIDGGGLTHGTEHARVLQSTLQNTLEQTVLAVLVHMIWAVTMPQSWLAAVPVAAILFLTGRILFVRGYARGAPSRALGFALTFYPSAVMLVVSTIAIALELFDTASV